MKAAEWRGRRDVALVELPTPIPASDEALVEVLWTGLCGSDLEEYLAGPVVVNGPVVLGHEIVGVVATAAEDGSGPPAGTTVVVDVVTGCGNCFQCARHEEGLCDSIVVTGQHRNGGLAGFVLGKASRLVPVPPGLSALHASLAEPLAVAVRAARKAGSLLGKGVLITGGGTVGMLLAQVARRAGAGPVVVVEPQEHRRAIMREWGIPAVWDDDATVRAERLRSLFPPRGIDVVAECSGHPGVIADALALARRGGTVLLLGVAPKPVEVDVLDLVLGEKTVRGSAAHMWDDDVATAVALLSEGAVDVAPMITHVVPLDDIDAAFRALAEPGSRAVKLVVDVAGGGSQDSSEKEPV